MVQFHSSVQIAAVVQRKNGVLLRPWSGVRFSPAVLRSWTISSAIERRFVKPLVGGLIPSLSATLRGRAAVAHRAHNPGVVGSIPTYATTSSFSVYALKEQMRN